MSASPCPFRGPPRAGCWSSHLSDDQILDFIPPEDFILPNGKRLEPAIFLRRSGSGADRRLLHFPLDHRHFTHCFAAPVYQTDGICIATLCLVAPRDDALANHQHYVKSLTNAAGSLTQRMVVGSEKTKEKKEASAGR